MKKGIICVLICGLMLAGTMLPQTTAYQQKILSNGSETQKESIFGNNHSAFIVGFFTNISWEGDRTILFTSGFFVPHDLPVMYITIFGFEQLGPDQQIQLINPKFCFFGKDFVIGFSKIFFPESTISMHIIKQTDEFNTVRWVVDNIEGDKVWGCNMRADVYYQNGSRYTQRHETGPYKPAYLTVGDEFQVTTLTDGVYQVKITDDITGRVLFTSPFIHF